MSKRRVRCLQNISKRPIVAESKTRERLQNAGKEGLDSCQFEEVARADPVSTCLDVGDPKTNKRQDTLSKNFTAKKTDPKTSEITIKNQIRRKIAPVHIRLQKKLEKRFCQDFLLETLQRSPTF